MPHWVEHLAMKINEALKCFSNVLTSLNTPSRVAANLSPGSSWRPCPVWCSGWELVFVKAATAGGDPPSQHCRRLDHVWLTVGGKHHCRQKEGRWDRTDRLWVLCYFMFSGFYLWDRLSLSITPTTSAANKAKRLLVLKLSERIQFFLMLICDIYSALCPQWLNFDP